MRLCVILYIRLFLSAWSLRFLRSLREKHKTIFYTPKTSSCCYILFLFALGHGNCLVKFLLFFRTLISRITRITVWNIFFANRTNRRLRQSIRAARCFVNCYRFSRMCDEVPVNLPAWGRVCMISKGNDFSILPRLLQGYKINNCTKFALMRSFFSRCGGCVE